MTQPDLIPIAAPAPVPTAGNLVKAVYVGERLPASAATTPEMVRDYWFRHITHHPWFDPCKEHLAVLLLNTKMHCFAWNLVSIGSLNEATAHPREILRPVIAAAAYGFVLMHNHPSGDSAPSGADQHATRKLKEGSELLNLRIIDHVIVGASPTDPFFSFRAAGIL